MMALHIWSMSHGIASLFGQAETRRACKLPMTAEDLLEAGVLIYLKGLGFPTDQRLGGTGKKLNSTRSILSRLTKSRDVLSM